VLVELQAEVAAERMPRVARLRTAAPASSDQLSASMPSAPAFETAAASCGTAGPPIGATIGCWMPSRSQTGVCMSAGYAPVVGKVYSEIDEKLVAWIEQQRLFFVATAPLAGDGHVNVSPKGDLRWFRILGPREVGYLDFVGSGAETIAHARENGRIVVMFCAFDGPPRIVRLHGRASVLPPTDELAARFDPPEHAVRSVIRIDVDRIADSCGYGVPLMRFDGMRTQQEAWVDKMVQSGGFDAYIAEKNAASIDGLPAL
jgi:hypothetical protein